MALFIYGSLYEAGGFIMYTLNTVLFTALYIFVILIASYLGAHGNTCAVLAL